jgi:hypothetical protein
MNHLLGISKDEEVVKIRVATEEEARACENGVLEVKLEPMRPYFGSPRPTAWNSALFDLFIEYFQDEIDEELDEDQIEESEDMFENRIQTLRRKWRQVRGMTADALKEKKLKDDKGSRANSRRDRVCFFLTSCYCRN